MKRIAAMLLALIILAGCGMHALGEEESVERNRVTVALEAAEEAAREAHITLNTYLSANEETQKAAMERGKSLVEEIKRTIKDAVITLEGDTDLRGAEKLMGGNNRIFTLDLNGYVLYAPVFAYGTFVVRNGVIGDAMGENEGGVLKLTFEEDCTLLADTNPAALDLDTTGELWLTNEGRINGIRKLIYQSSAPKKTLMVNSGVIWSDTTALSFRAFHQNSTISLTNGGVIAGQIRGLDVHCGGGSLTVDGTGEILGAAGPEIEIPRVTISCGIVADDHGLPEETLRAINDRLDPYGDKDVPTGIAFDWMNFSVDYWSTWQITGTVWASRGILRMNLPLNSQMKGSFGPAIEAGSLSRTASCAVTIPDAVHDLTGSRVESVLEGFWSNMNMEGYFRQGGEMTIQARSRYAAEDGRKHVIYSVADTRWSHLAGVRSGSGFAWQPAENGALESQEPVQTVNDFWQMRAAMSQTGAGGVVVMDRDASLTGEEGPLTLLQDITLLGEGHHLGGQLQLVVDRAATLTGFDLKGETLSLTGIYKTGNGITLNCGRIGGLNLDNVSVSSDGSTDQLFVMLRGGELSEAIQVNKRLTVDATERVPGTYTFDTDVGEETSVRLIFSRNSFGKTLIFRGSAACGAVEVLIQNEKNPEVAVISTEPDPMTFYAPYLKMISLDGWTDAAGARPAVTMVDEGGNALITFLSDGKGGWVREGESLLVTEEEETSAQPSAVPEGEASLPESN